MSQDNYEYWAVTGPFEGEVKYYQEGTNFPETGVIEVFDFFDIIQESILKKRFELRIKVAVDLDHVQVATMVTERILEAVLLASDNACRATILSMDKIEPNESEKEKYLDTGGIGVVDEWEPFVHGENRANLVYFGGGFGSWKYLKPEIIDNIRSKWRTLNRIEYQDIFAHALNYYKRGAQLEYTWPSEAYFNYYKAIELFMNKKFRNDYLQIIKNEIKPKFEEWCNQFRPNLQSHEINKKVKEFAKSMDTNEMVLQYMCKTIGFDKKYDKETIEEMCKKLTDIRDQIGHPASKIVKIEDKVFEFCKNFAKHLVQLTNFQ